MIVALKNRGRGSEGIDGGCWKGGIRSQARLGMGLGRAVRRRLGTEKAQGMMVSIRDGKIVSARYNRAHRAATEVKDKEWTFEYIG